MALYEMLHLALYEVVIASGIAVVLVVATIGGLAARIRWVPNNWHCCGRRARCASTWVT